MISLPLFCLLELGFECSKRISDLYLDFIKSVDDRAAISEVYIACKEDLHVHFPMNRMWYATHRRMNGIKVRVANAIVSKGGKLPADFHKLPMFVWI
jgi:hypothetical protein